MSEPVNISGTKYCSFCYRLNLKAAKETFAPSPKNSSSWTTVIPSMRERAPPRLEIMVEICRGKREALNLSEIRMIFFLAEIFSVSMMASVLRVLKKTSTWRRLLLFPGLILSRTS